MSNTTIRNILENKLKSWAVSNNINNIAYEGVAFEKPTTTWIEAKIDHAATINPTVDAIRKTYFGILQININVKDGNGTRVIETLADSLIQEFAVLPKLGNLSIERTPYVGSSWVDAQWRVLPVRINYRYEVY